MRSSKRTPIDKLLTFDQMEEFSKLLQHKHTKRSRSNLDQLPPIYAVRSSQHSDLSRSPFVAITPYRVGLQSPSVLPSNFPHL